MKNIFQKPVPEKFGQHHAEKVLEIVGQNEGEEPLHAVRRHWVVLARRIVLFVLIAFCCFSLAIFRSIGGSLFVMDTIYAGQLDIINIMIGIGVAVLAISLLWPQKSGTKKGPTYQILRGFLFGLIVIFALRYMGTRIFVFDPSAAQVGANVLDVFNIALLVIGLVSLGYAVYEYFEWEDDFLVLTNQRVITYHQELLGQHHQDQMGIEDVQNVQGKTQSYAEHLLGFGTLTIKSATLNRDMVFKDASLPWDMQKKISGEANKTKSAKSTDDLQRLIETVVFDNPQPPKPKPKKLKTDPGTKPLFMRWKEKLQKSKSSRKRFASNVPGFLRGLGVPENPQVEPADWQEKGKILPDKITWRRHWIFFVIAMLKPLAVLAVGLPLTIGAYLLGAVSAVLLVFLIIGVLIIFAGVYLWESEDYVNDPYILDQKALVDVEKKPFGPEDRVTAGLDKIQNVSMNTNFISRMFNFGDVTMTTAGSDKPLTFTGVPQPGEVVATINEALAEFRRREKERTFKDSVELLKQYHKVSQDHQQQEMIQPKPTEAGAAG